MGYILHLSRSLIFICKTSTQLFSYHNDRQKREGKNTAQYEHAVRVNDTLDAMSEEQKLLALNLNSVGGRLNEFTYRLFEAMEWKSVVDRIVQTTPDSIKGMRRMDGRKIRPGSWEASDDNFERYIMVMIFAQQLLGVLDFVDGVNRPVARAAACIEIIFTRGFTPDAFMYFIPVEEE